MQGYSQSYCIEQLPSPHECFGVSHGTQTTGSTEVVPSEVFKHIFEDDSESKT